jgi:hypothetical protein
MSLSVKEQHMKHTHITLRTIVAAVLIASIGTAWLGAHTMTLKGTVAAVEPKRIQIKTGEEKKGEAPEWSVIDAKTKIYRDKTVVTFEAAKITVGEKAVVVVDHDANKMTATEIHLAAK